jgi:PncC family amidohydrolase
MAGGAVRIAGAEIGLSTTGIAGPSGGTEDKPVGLVYIGMAHGEHSVTRRFRFGRDRAMNKECAVRTALDLVRRHLLEQ